MANELTQFWERTDQHRSTLIFNVYRVSVVTIFILSDLFHWGGVTINEQLQILFVSASLVYILFTIVSVYWAYRRIQFNKVAITHALIDVCYFLILMHSFSGVSNLYPIFMNLAILGNGIVLPEVIVLPYVAMIMLFSTGYHYYFQLHDVISTLQLSLWFASFLMTGIVVRLVVVRLKYTQALASERGLHLFNLEKMSEHIINSLENGVILLDADHKIRLINHAARLNLNLSDSYELSHLDDLPEKLTFHLENWLDAQGYDDGSVSPLYNGFRLKFNHIGQKDFPAIAIFLEDTSKTVQEAQSMKLDSLGRFTASVAHELRNPLGAVSHAVQLLAESPNLTEHDEKLISIIYSQSERMNEIIKNVLQLSRRTQAQGTQIKLYQWLKDFRDKYKQLKTDAIEFSIDVENKKLEINFDVSQLQQVISNLCDNAVKQTKVKGRKTKIIFKAYQAEHGQDVMLEIQDNGPGFNEKQYPHLFEPFFTTDRQGGTGLGLYLSKELCEANRAFIKAVYPSKNGACFIIHFKHSEQHISEFKNPLIQDTHENSLSG